MDLGQPSPEPGSKYEAVLMDTVSILPSAINRSNVSSVSSDPAKGKPASPRNTDDAASGMQEGQFSGELAKLGKAKAQGVERNEQVPEIESAVPDDSALVSQGSGTDSPEHGESLPPGLLGTIKPNEFEDAVQLDGTGVSPISEIDIGQLQGVDQASDTAAAVGVQFNPVTPNEVASNASFLTSTLSDSLNPKANSLASIATPLGPAMTYNSNNGSATVEAMMGKPVFGQLGESLSALSSSASPTSSVAAGSDALTTVMNGESKSVLGLMESLIVGASTGSDKDFLEPSSAGINRVLGGGGLNSGLSTPVPLSTIRTESSTTIPLASGAPFGTQGWSDAVANRVMWLTDNRMMTAELRLDPPDLGPLQVKIAIADGQAQVSFVSQSSDVRGAIDQSVARLRELFDEKNVELVNVDISDQPSSNRDSSGQQLNTSNETSNTAENGLLESTEDISAVESLDENLSQLTGLVDYYV
ncbi:MAG: flagellar hook-length control protein FliK [Pseudomonadales bacterium]|nr:flagellar hook-length control protein FliK [Pseudomonadales bacterium]